MEAENALEVGWSELLELSQMLGTICQHFSHKRD